MTRRSSSRGCDAGAVPPTSTSPVLAGHAVHLLESPGEGPLVLFTGGAGIVADYWTAVTELLPGVHWAALDRPGLGGTPWPGTLPTLAESVTLLAEVVRTLGAPAVLVAQSMAGYHVEALARRHPELVAGLVLVDSSVSFYTSPPRELPVALPRTVHRLARRRALRALGGLLHQVGASTLVRDPAQVLRTPALRHPYTDADALAAVVAEYCSWSGQGWDLLGVRSAHPFPDVPVVVLSASSTGGRDWLAKQHRLARMLHARQVVTDEGKHLLMIDQPEMVAEAVESVRRQVARG